jgi:transcription antitermination factor NusG
MDWATGFFLFESERHSSRAHSRERRGAIELAKPPQFRCGDRVRILRGPLQGHLGIYAGMKPRERVEVLLRLLGSEQRVIMAKQNVEAVDGL